MENETKYFYKVSNTIELKKILETNKNIPKPANKKSDFHDNLHVQLSIDYHLLCNSGVLGTLKYS